jgi:hypothetical protein
VSLLLLIRTPMVGALAPRTEPTPPGRQSPAALHLPTYRTATWALANQASGVPGATVTTANSGGPNQFDAATVTGAGTTLTYDAGNYHDAPTSIKVSLAPGVSSTAFVGFNGPTGELQRFCRFYYWLTGPVPQAIPIMVLGTNVPSIRMDAAGRIALYDTNGTLNATMANPLPLGQWVRIEMDYTALVWGSGCSVTVRVYSGANLETNTPDAGGTLARTGVALGGTHLFTALRFGVNSAVTEPNGYTCWYAGIAVNNYAPPGPAPPVSGMTSVTGVRTPMLVPPGISSPMARRLTPGIPQQPAAAPPAAAPQLRGAPVQARQLPARGGRAASRAGARAQAGAPVKPAAGPVQARQPLPARGRTAGRAGTYAQAGPPARPPAGPVQARRQPVRGGSAQGRAGAVTATAAQPGPPVYPLGHPVTAKRFPQRGGHVTRAAGTYAGTGAPVKAPEGPVQARQPLPARGRTASRAGTFTTVVTGSGPPLYPAGHPVQARRQAAQGGRVIRRAGTYAGSGPPVPPLHQPIGVQRRQPPPPARGRTASLRGPYSGTGPPAIPLRRPVRGQPQKPLLTGRTASRAGVAVLIPPPPFTIGTLASGDAAASTLTATGGSSALTAATAAQAILTAADQRTGGPS